MMAEPLTGTPRVLADFIGPWHLHRAIAHADGTTGVFDGTAVWTPAGAGAQYRETGVLTLNGAEAVTATQAYRWSDRLEVFFRDGRFFHHVPPQGGQTRHWCDPDSYAGRYDFAEWPAFTTLWQVSGPRKSYEMHSRYTRRARKRS